jgi:hypothetical protein
LSIARNKMSAENSEKEFAKFPLVSTDPILRNTTFEAHCVIMISLIIRMQVIYLFLAIVETVIPTEARTPLNCRLFLKYSDLVLNYYKLSIRMHNTRICISQSETVCTWVHALKTRSQKSFQLELEINTRSSLI